MNEIKKVLNLTVKAGEVLLYNGAEIFRVQETMVKIAEAYNVDSFHVYVLSNGIFASVSENGEVYNTEIRYIPLSPVHLGRVTAVNNLSRDIVDGKYTVDEAFEKLDEIMNIPYTPDIFQVLFSGIGSACFCYLFGGSAYDSLISFFSGVILYVFILFSRKLNLSKIVTNIWGSGLVTLCGLLFFHLGMGNNLDKIIIGSIIPLVPGVALTTSIRDFLNSDYLSGTIRLIDALLIAFCIAIGVGLMLKIWNMVSGVTI